MTMNRKMTPNEFFWALRAIEDLDARVRMMVSDVRKEAFLRCELAFREAKVNHMAWPATRELTSERRTFEL